MSLKNLLTFFFVIVGLHSFSQIIPVGTPLFEDAYRRMLMKGEQDSNVSFMIRPLVYADVLQADSTDPAFRLLTGNNNHNSYSFAKGKGIIKVLPATLNLQYNTHHPYGWNDGSMIQARGFQNQLTAGVYAKIGFLSVQLKPEFVFAQNKNFSTFPASYDDKIWLAYTNYMNQIDNPEKYGTGSYTKLFPGQSSIRINYKKLSLGVSTENLWWGPGYRNSLIMSNNAPGFPHITFNSSSPVVSPIGAFEWQLASCILKNSNVLPFDTSRKVEGQSLYRPKFDDDRYFNGLVLTWQPKWIKGLFLGFSRSFYTYTADLHSFENYLPIFDKIFKKKIIEREDSSRKDQMFSLFFRLVLPSAKAELYGEYGRNDHAWDTRDLLLEPEHSRAYTIGFRKIFDGRKGKETEFFTEITNMQMPSTISLRPQNSWYAHHMVTQGYTNYGQVMGSGIGPGSNSQTLGVNILKGIDKFGVMLERVAWNNDFYYAAFASTENFGRHWVDYSINLNKTWARRHFVYAADLTYIRSLNYQWSQKNDVSNILAKFSVSYLF